jgi:hypothetical protein
MLAVPSTHRHKRCACNRLFDRSALTTFVLSVWTRVPVFGWRATAWLAFALAVAAGVASSAVRAVSCGVLWCVLLCCVVLCCVVVVWCAALHQSDVRSGRLLRL